MAIASLLNMTDKTLNMVGKITKDPVGRKKECNNQRVKYFFKNY